MPPMDPVRLELLADDDLDRIHHAAVRVLAEVGARIMTEEGRRLLLDHGASVGGEEGDTVTIPPQLVAEAL
jgi:trimethylamine:corrinoid methyltransferase-like protein